MAERKGTKNDFETRELRFNLLLKLFNQTLNLHINP